MSVDDRQNFQTLRHAFCAGDAALPECRNIDPERCWPCPAPPNKLPGGPIEFIPIARKFNRALASVVLTAPGQEGSTVRAELN